MVAIRLRCGVAVIALSLAISTPAFAGEDDLFLDLGSANDKPSDAGAGLRKLELRRIPKGTFVEGSAASDAYREPDEVQRNVVISKTFWMGKYPVTKGQFARFVAETRHQTDAEKGQNGGFGFDGARLKQDKQYTWRSPGFTQTDDDPVTLVTFGDANAFAAWASRKTGRRVRLPTEAEFEYAARAGTTTPWYAAKSEEEASALGWYRPLPGQAVGTHPVGKKKPNAWGLFDMTGNVNQWCRDVYAVWPAADVTDPENTTNATNEAERRVLRGGSWMRDPRRGRSASRYRNAPGTRNADNGFRIVVEDAPVIAPAPGQASSADLAPSAAPPPAAVAPLVSDGGVPLVQATPVVQRPASSEGMAWAFLVMPVAAISFVVSWMLARRKKEATNAQGIITRVADDGFYMRAPHLPAGTRVRYTCIVRGSEVADIVALEDAEETFVFTSGEPSLIHIVPAVKSTPALITPVAPSEPLGPRSSSRMPGAPSVPPAIASEPLLGPRSSSRVPAAPSVPPAIASEPLLGPRSSSRMPAAPSVPPAVVSEPLLSRVPASVPPALPTGPLPPPAPSVPPSSRSPWPSDRALPAAPSVPPSSRSPASPSVASSSRAPASPSVPPALPSSRAPASPSVPPALPSSLSGLSSAPPALPSSRPMLSGPLAPPSIAPSSSRLPSAPPIPPAPLSDLPGPPSAPSVVLSNLPAPLSKPPLALTSEPSLQLPAPPAVDEPKTPPSAPAPSDPVSEGPPTPEGPKASDPPASNDPESND